MFELILLDSLLAILIVLAVFLFDKLLLSLILKINKIKLNKKVLSNLVITETISFNHLLNFIYLQK